MGNELVFQPRRGVFEDTIKFLMSTLCMSLAYSSLASVESEFRVALGSNRAYISVKANLHLPMETSLLKKICYRRAFRLIS